jgi:hypothetical protein
MAYIRFPIPAFDHKALRGLEWSPPDLLDRGAMTTAMEDAGKTGAFAVTTDGSLLEKLNIQGEHCHAHLCMFPAGARLVGQSHSWWLQRALIVDSLDSATANVIADWRTPRPMNTRFGPENGIELPEGPLFVISSHAVSDHWVGNRTLTQDIDGGYRILGAAKDDTANFHEFCLSFTWGN